MPLVQHELLTRPIHLLSTSVFVKVRDFVRLYWRLHVSNFCLCCPDFINGYVLTIFYLNIYLRKPQTKTSTTCITLIYIYCIYMTLFPYQFLFTRVCLLCTLFISSYNINFFQKFSVRSDLPDSCRSRGESLASVTRSLIVASIDMGGLPVSVATTVTR